MSDETARCVVAKFLKMNFLRGSKRKTGSEIETGFSLSYEGLEPSTHALKGRCSTN